MVAPLISTPASRRCYGLTKSNRKCFQHARIGIPPPYAPHTRTTLRGRLRFLYFRGQTNASRNAPSAAPGKSAVGVAGWARIRGRRVWVGHLLWLFATLDMAEATANQNVFLQNPDHIIVLSDS